MHALVRDTLKLTLFLQKWFEFTFETGMFLLLRLILARLPILPKLPRARLLRLARLARLRLLKLLKLPRLLMVARFDMFIPGVILHPLLALLLLSILNPRGETNIFWLLPGMTLIKEVPAGSFPAAMMALISEPRPKPDDDVVVEFEELWQFVFIEFAIAVQRDPLPTMGTTRVVGQVLAEVVGVVEVITVVVSGE